jgi:hypothetical protein
LHFNIFCKPPFKSPVPTADSRPPYESQKNENENEKRCMAENDDISRCNGKIKKTPPSKQSMKEKGKKCETAK